ncbi:hypothetical protein GC163_03755 [bacterium]|nr:hypothetical protein [bacterium]
MTDPIPARKLTQRLLGNHNRSWIWGRHTVLVTLQQGQWFPLVVQLSPRCPVEVAAQVRALCAQHSIDCREVTDAQLAKTCRAEDHQGLAAQMPEFPYTELELLLSQSVIPSSWLVLDSIQDSFNFGAMVRTAVELGLEAVLIGCEGQSGVNSQVARSSAGGVNCVPIARVSDLPAAVQRLQQRQIQIVAASEKAKQLVQDCDLTVPTAVIVGNEGRGVSADLRALCESHVRIPTTGHLGSLNAAVAAAIFSYELVRQRRSTV